MGTERQNDLIYKLRTDQIVLPLPLTFYGKVW